MEIALRWLEIGFVTAVLFLLLNNAKQASQIISSFGQVNVNLFKTIQGR